MSYPTFVVGERAWWYEEPGIPVNFNVDFSYAIPQSNYFYMNGQYVRFSTDLRGTAVLLKPESTWSVTMLVVSVDSGNISPGDRITFNGGMGRILSGLVERI